MVRLKDFLKISQRAGQTSAIIFIVWGNRVIDGMLDKPHVPGRAMLRLMQLVVIVTVLAVLGISSSKHLAANASAPWLNLPPDLLASITAGPETPTFVLQPLPEDAPDEALTQQLTLLCSKYPVAVVPYIYTLNLQTGLSASLRGQEPVPAASVIKLPLLASLYSRVAQGDFAPETTTWQFLEIHRASGSGDLQYQKAGQWLTVQKLAEKMIQISDNTTSNIILDNLGGMETVNQQWQQWGLTHTHMNNWLPDLRGTNVISMRDMARLLYNVEQPKGWLPEEHKAAMKTILLGTMNKRLLVAGVPTGTPVAHKTGDIGTVIGDVGTVRIGDQTVIVCVMARRPRNHPLGRQLVRDVMTTVYTHTLASQTPEKINYRQ
jgi:beta-lactamase class A